MPDAATAADAQPPTASDDSAKRLAAEKKARDRVARNKADREAKARAGVEQREQAVTRARAEQELNRRRAEEALRARPLPPTAGPAALVNSAPAQARTTRELCGGRGLIGEGLCQARECASAAHLGEALCRQLRDAQDRRQNHNN